MRALTQATAKLFSPIHLSPYDRMHLSLTKEGDRFVADVYQVGQFDSAKKGYPSIHASSTFFARVPERKEIDKGYTFCRYELAATDFTVSLIDALWDRKQLVFDADAELAYQYILATGNQLDGNAECFARYKEYVQLSVNNDRYTMMHASALKPIFRGKYQMRMNREKPLALYQQVALYNMMRSEGYALFMEQGTGKTPIAIAEVDNAALANTSGKTLKVLIVCPNNVRLNWVSEFHNFSTVPGAVTVLRGGDINRTKLFLDAMSAPATKCKYTVVVCSYETMVRSWNLIKAVPWDICDLDEAHYIKSPYTQRMKKAMELRDVCKKRRILTGTPITNTPLDLYAQLEFLGQGWSGFINWQNFRTFYGVYRTEEETGHKRLVAMQNLPFMQERLARCSFIITKKEALPSLPEKVFDVMEVEMTSEQAQIYRDVASKLYVEIENDLAGAENKSMMITNILTKLLRLAQITSGFVTWDPVYSDDGEVISARAIDRLDPNPKVEALVEELKRRKVEEPLSKTIVWACWTQDIKTLAARLTLEGIRHVTFYGGTTEKERVEAERAFNNDDDCRVFIGNAAAGGTGLNLLGYPPGKPELSECNADWTVYMSQNWSPTARSQSGDRNHRRGTRTQVRETDLCVPNSIDEEIRTRVLEKRVTASTISDIRQILLSVLGGMSDE